MYASFFSMDEIFHNKIKLLKSKSEWGLGSQQAQPEDIVCCGIAGIKKQIK